MHSLTCQWQERHIKRCFERHCESVALAPNPRLEKSEDRSRAPLGWRTRFNVQLRICALTVTLRRKRSVQLQGAGATFEFRRPYCGQGSVPALRFEHLRRAYKTGHHVATTNVLLALRVARSQGQRTAQSTRPPRTSMSTTPLKKSTRQHMLVQIHVVMGVTDS